MILTVDPGLRMCGAALWTRDGRLVSGALIKGAAEDRDAKAWATMAGEVWEWTKLETWRLQTAPVTFWVSEFPKVYTVGKSKGDPDDLLQLAGVVGALTGKLGPGEIVRPYQWKGQVPKPVMVERIKSKLTAEELELVRLPRAKSLHHNIWDAVGIGLWYFDHNIISPRRSGLQEPPAPPSA